MAAEEIEEEAKAQNLLGDEPDSYTTGRLEKEWGLRALDDEPGWYGTSMQSVVNGQDMFALCVIDPVFYGRRGYVLFTESEKLTFKELNGDVGDAFSEHNRLPIFWESYPNMEKWDTMHDEWERDMLWAAQVKDFYRITRGLRKIIKEDPIAGTKRFLKDVEELIEMYPEYKKPTDRGVMQWTLCERAPWILLRNIFQRSSGNDAQAWYKRCYNLAWTLHLPELNSRVLDPTETSEAKQGFGGRSGVMHGGQLFVPSLKRDC